MRKIGCIWEQGQCSIARQTLVTRKLWVLNVLVQQILTNWHTYLSDCSSASLVYTPFRFVLNVCHWHTAPSIDVATATPHSSALHMKQSSGVSIPEINYSMYQCAYSRLVEYTKYFSLHICFIYFNPARCHPFLAGECLWLYAIYINNTFLSPQIFQYQADANFSVTHFQ